MTYHDIFTLHDAHLCYIPSFLDLAQVVKIPCWCEDSASVSYTLSLLDLAEIIENLCRCEYSELLLVVDDADLDVVLADLPFEPFFQRHWKAQISHQDTHTSAVLKKNLMT